MNDNDIVFDGKSGISAEEQKEILAQINGIAEKNRTALSQTLTEPQGKRKSVNAKKSGALFPLSVNIAAVVVLAAGAFVLILFNTRIDAQVRTGSAVYNLTERALIEEIRKDMAEKITAKDREISEIISLLEGVDAQLFLLQFDNMSLEQLSAQESLLELQRIYRGDLWELQEERSKILEEYRSREAVLRAQLIERAKEITAIRQSEHGAANELEALSDEQRKIAAIEAQFTGGFTVIGEMIQSRQYSAASLALDNLRLLNNNNTIAASPSYQTRREFYNQSIDSMSVLINEMRRFQGTDDTGLELIETNIRLEETVTEMQKIIDALNEGSDGQARLFTEMEESNSSLRAAISALETNVTERNRRITALETSGAEKDRTIGTLQANNTEKDRTISTLETNAAERNRTISSLETERTALNQTVTSLTASNTAQEREITSLRNQLDVIRQLLME